MRQTAERDDVIEVLGHLLTAREALGRATVIPGRHPFRLGDMDKLMNCYHRLAPFVEECRKWLREND